MSYQDVIVDGCVVSKGDRECATRYAAVREVFTRWQRPFTVLDLGAAQGYFSLRAVQDFPEAHAVMVEADEDLLKICAEARPPRTVLLRERVSARDLELLAACEHFDVVLALNVLHHLPPMDAAAALRAVMEMADLAVIEVPPVGDHGACGGESIKELAAALARYPEGELIHASPSHVTPGVMREVRAYETPKRSLSRSYFDLPAGIPARPIEIRSSANAKTVAIAGREERAWFPGINLRTYQRLGGAWPPREAVAAKVEAVEISKPHGDVRPWNFVLDGEAVHLIDGGDDRANFPDDAAGLAMTAEAVRTGEDPAWGVAA